MFFSEEDIERIEFLIKSTDVRKLPSGSFVRYSPCPCGGTCSGECTGSCTNGCSGFLTIG